MTSITNNDSGHARFRVPRIAQAVGSGLVVGLTAANVWPLLLVGFGMPVAGILEAGFLALYFWWASGHGFPASLKQARRDAFRATQLTRAQWLFGVAAALVFALTVHAALVVLFRLVPFPAALFHRDYQLGMSMALPLKWAAVVVAAASAAICEETGFRGYMQKPIETRHGALTAIAISSVLFTVFHLSKSWAIPGMVPIVLGAGVLLGLIAWASNSLIPGILGHTVMDIGMFGYWWTGLAGTFGARTIAVTGIDLPFLLACAVSVAGLAITLLLIAKLRAITAATF
jgi:membrane protease YdiL (CAAX protease family)